MPTVQARIFTVGISWQPMESLATGGVHWQIVNLVPTKFSDHTIFHSYKLIYLYPTANKIVMGGVQMCASPRNTFCWYKSLRGASNLQDLINTRRAPVFPPKATVQ